MEHLFFEFGIIVAGGALLAWLATLFRQPIIVAYLACGVLAGPWGLGLVTEVTFLDAISQFGVSLLLFLAGMVLHPQRLVSLFRKSMLVTLSGAAVSFLSLALIVRLFGFPMRESVIVGVALMFSSTILVIKLLPTTTLHQRHMGSICIAILIIQDLLAVLALMFLGREPGPLSWILVPVKAALIVAGALLFERWVLRRMMRQTDHYHEVLYLLCIGWCLAVCLLAESFGLSLEAGAFVAGVAVAQSPVSRFLTEQLKPMRDFFLTFFFFTLGARLDPAYFMRAWAQVLVVTGVLLATRPMIYAALFRYVREQARFAREVGLRLGQASEFGLIIAMAAVSRGLLGDEAANLITFTVVLSMILSSYLVVLTCPSPLGTDDSHKQD